ncbi:hypothetical protein EJB05_55423, partial [Eragrostis curvula]
LNTAGPAQFPSHRPAIPIAALSELSSLASCGAPLSSPLPIPAALSLASSPPDAAAAEAGDGERQPPISSKDNATASLCRPPHTSDLSARGARRLGNDGHGDLRRGGKQGSHGPDLVVEAERLGGMVTTAARLHVAALLLAGLRWLWHLRHSHPRSPPHPDQIPGRRGLLYQSRQYQYE